MAKSRARVTLKLLALLALPVSVVGLLFGFGVSVGIEHRLSILRFERALGLPSDLLTELEARGDHRWWKIRNPEAAKAVAGAPAPGAAGKGPPVGTSPAAAASPSIEAPAAPSPGEAGPASAQAAVQDAPVLPAPVQAAEGSPPTTPGAVAAGEPAPAVTGGAPVGPIEGAAVPGRDAAPSSSAPRLVVSADPVPEEYAQALAKLRIVRVKVVVDDGYRASHPGWIDDMQQLVDDASAIYEVHFGLRLELVAISRWEVSGSMGSSDTLLEDLRGEAREGADVLVGVTGVAMENGEVDGKAEAPTARHEVNGAHLVLYSSGADGRPRLRSLLHELGHLHGADDMLDPSSEAWKKSSWMSYAPAPEGGSPWIDRESRAIILKRKFLPYVATTHRAGEPARGGVR